MDKKFIVQQKQILEEKKDKLTSQLSSFAKVSEENSDNWTAKIPSFDAGQSIEEEADEVQEFDTRLALEHTLEKELKDVNTALERIKKDEYGLCQKCQKPIAEGRLKAYPQAENCAKCQ